MIIETLHLLEGPQKGRRGKTTMERKKQGEHPLLCMATSRAEQTAEGKGTPARGKGQTPCHAGSGR